MISLLSDSHSSLGVSDGGVELTELEEHFGEPRPRKCRLNNEPTEALVAKVAFECDVSLEQGGCIAKLAPRFLHEAKKARRHYFDRAIAEGARDSEGFLPHS